MFRRLSRRIVLITLLSVSVCTLAIGLFSYQWAKKTIVSEFVDVSSNYYQNSYDLLQQYLNYIGETAKMIASNPNVAREIQKTDASSSDLSQLLDGITFGMNLEIRGISLYKEDGSVVTLNRMSNVPPLEALTEDERIRRFVGDPGTKFMWISRYKNLSLYYNGQYRENGTYSYLLKWAGDKGDPLGMMVIDLDLDRLFNFFNTENVMFQDNRLLLLRDGDNWASSSPNGKNDGGFALSDLAQIKNAREGRFISHQGDKLVLYRELMDPDTKIVMTIPLKHSITRISGLKQSILSLSVLSVLIAAMLALMLKASIVRPLTHLYTRMRAFK